MGRIGKLLQFMRLTRRGAELSESKINTGGGALTTAEHFAPPGDDSHPLPGDWTLSVGVQGSGRESVAGYIDPSNESKAATGEKRIYARGADGGQVAELWLKATGEATLANANGSVTLNADGSILGTNGAGSFNLQTSGDFVVNGVTIAANGDVTIPNSLVLAGKELADHDHNILSGSSAPGPTGVNN